MAKSLDINMDSVFRHFDRDGDGKISSAELSHCTKAVGIELSVDDIEQAVEFDEDGLVDCKELDVMLLNSSMGEEEEERRIRGLREAFRMFATTTTTEVEEECIIMITPRSLERMLSRLGNSWVDVEDCQAMIRRFDLDGDGAINFDEFKIMMA